MKSVFLLSLASLAIVSATRLDGYLSKEDIPSSGRDWYTLDNGVEFQPSDNSDIRVEHVRKLWGKSKKQDVPNFLDGSETYYDENAQAWRLLGFYIDCNHCENGDNEAACIQEGQETTCQRYLLWAAYVDLEYSGSGAGEYIMYDRLHKKWNSDACKQSGSQRCVKMDCHESNSHWSLLGLFKEPDYNNFMQQLFTFQGDCTWTQKEFATMASAMSFMPDGCTQASNGLYYDIKPATGGSATIAIYDDQYCTVEHSSSKNSVKKTLGVDDTVSWNNAFDAFKYCHPCRVSDYSSKSQRRLEDANENAYNQNCQADNGLNQCQQFAKATNMIPANYHDVMIAEEQGTLSYLKIGGVSVGVTQKALGNKWFRNLRSAFFMIACLLGFLWSLLRCAKEIDENPALKQPLMNDDVTINSQRSRRSSGITGGNIASATLA